MEKNEENMQDDQQNNLMSNTPCFPFNYSEGCHQLGGVTANCTKNPS